MDDDSIRLLVIFSLTVVLSACFSCAESAVSLMKKIKIKQLAEDGDKRAAKALYISEHFEKALTTLLICINITHIAAATVATLLVRHLLTNATDDTVNTVSTFGATAVVFLLGEMIPKALANDRNEKTLLFFAPLVRVLMTVLTPLSLFFTAISSLFVKLFKVKPKPSITEDELIDIIDTAEEEGVVDEEQSDMLKSAMQFQETTASHVMTPRENIECIPVDMPVPDILCKIQGTNHSRLPVYEGDLDHIIGYLSARAFLREYLNKKGKLNDIRPLLIPSFFVRPDAKIDDLLSTMREHKCYMAVVSQDGVNASRHTLGIVTMEDFLEELVGDIWDETDIVDSTFIRLGGNRFRVDTHMPVGELFTRLNCRMPDSRIAKTPLLAWVLEMLRHFPSEGESFSYESVTVTVDEVVNHRIPSVEVSVDPDFDAENGIAFDTVDSVTPDSSEAGPEISGKGGLGV